MNTNNPYGSKSGKLHMDERRFVKKKPKVKHKNFKYETTDYYLSKGMFVCENCGKMLSVDFRKCNSCGFVNEVIISRE